MSDWFEAGAGVAMGHGDRYPPLGDGEAQRWWLGGFGAAWAAGTDERPVVVVLVAALRGQEALHGQLRALGGGQTPRGLH